MNLFAAEEERNREKARPLAARMRPPITGRIRRTATHSGRRQIVAQNAGC